MPSNSMGASKTVAKLPLALYFHVPFCTFKCGYCDFCALQIGKNVTKSTEKVIQSNTKVLQNDIKVVPDLYQNDIKMTSKCDNILQMYSDCITNSIQTSANVLQTRAISSIFFGGGTPSLLSAEQIGAILGKVRATTEIAPNAEITLESNPDDLNESYLQELANIGITRLSIGVQSFDSAVLKALERQHNPQQVAPAVKIAKSLGLKVSLDLIYGAPGETLTSWRQTLEQAIALEPHHISAYALTLEKNVRLAKIITRGKMAPVDEDLQAEMYQLADEMLTNAGYQWYEISNWELLTDIKGNENRSSHNLNYWQNGEWLGFGPSAHSHLITPMNEQRFWVTNDVNQWLANPSTPPETENITPSQARLEETMLEARLNMPINMSKYEPQALQTLIADDFLNEQYIPTLKGRLLNDTLIATLDSSRKEHTCPRYQTKQCIACPQCEME